MEMVFVPFVMKKFSLTIYDSFCFKDLNAWGKNWVLLLSLGRSIDGRGSMEYCMHHEHQCSMRMLSSLFEVGVSPASTAYLRLN